MASLNRQATGFSPLGLAFRNNRGMARFAHLYVARKGSFTSLQVSRTRSKVLENIRVVGGQADGWFSVVST
jgi:uncharacterized membrane protein YcjF (UPF0283 family)